MMYQAWDNNAYGRHKQLLDRKDKTFWQVLSPEIFKLLQSFEGFSSFSVLDVGCGTGILSMLLSEQVEKVVGIDPSEISISIAENYAKDQLAPTNTKVEFLRSPIEDFTYPHMFDLAVAHMVMQAVKPIEAALKKISILLKPEGRFIFSIHHPCFWPEVKKDLFQPDYNYYVESTHKIPFQISSSDPLKEYVPYFHRSLGVYSKYLFEAGFVIEKMLEPFPDEKLVEEGYYKRPWKYPGFLIFACRKY